jgi:tRNA threonylcarbamoyladenosine biosynthesis protein TsaE
MAAEPTPPLPWNGVTHEEEETREWGRRLAALLTGGEVIRLRGELGAGKTTFTRGLAEGLGASPDQVHSPTYSLVHIYRDGEGHPVLHHVELYRVEGEVDLEEIGLEDVFAARVPAAVEWPERLRTSRHRVAPGDLDVSLEVMGPNRRRITVTRAAAT